MDKIIIKHNNNEYNFNLHSYYSDKFTRTIKVILYNKNINILYRLYDRCDFKVYFNLLSRYNFTLLNPSIKFIDCDDYITVIFTIENDGQYEHDKQL